MSLKNTLTRLMKVVIEEAERNPKFEEELNAALGSSATSRRSQPKKATEAPAYPEGKRGKHRRPQAVLDPVQIVRNGEAALRMALSPLSLDQLRDIVAEYGMDPARLVMKWEDPARVVDRIVELSVARGRKGDAFRKPTEEGQALDRQMHYSETQVPAPTEDLGPPPSDASEHDGAKVS